MKMATVLRRYFMYRRICPQWSPAFCWARAMGGPAFAEGNEAVRKGMRDTRRVASIAECRAAWLRELAGLQP